MKFAGALFLALLLAIPGGAEEGGDPQMAIRAARQRLAAAERRGDAPAILESYAEDVILLPPDEPEVSGRPAAGRWLEAAERKAAMSASSEFETLSVEVYGIAASEIGEEIFGGGTPGNPGPAIRVRHLTIWRKQPDGSWKITRDAWNRPLALGPVRASTAPASPVPAPAPIPAPPASREQFVPIPDPRSLSDGLTREIQDKLRSRAGKIRSLEAAPPSTDRDARLSAAEKEAARYLETTIRDIGWIDIRRFQVSGSCDASWIVQKSGDRRLMESTLPIMEKDLKNSEGSECYASALKAYAGLPPKN